MNKKILLVWQGTNEQSSGTITETDDMIVVYLDNKSKWEQMEKDIEAYYQALDEGRLPIMRGYQ